MMTRMYHGVFWGTSLGREFDIFPSMATRQKIIRLVYLLALICSTGLCNDFHHLIAGELSNPVLDRIQGRFGKAHGYLDKKFK